MLTRHSLLFFLSFLFSPQPPHPSPPFLQFFMTDVVLTIDCVQYYFFQIFKITSIWPPHLFTISSLALKASFYHSKSPDNPTQRLFLRHLSEPIWNEFKQCLTGGYSTVNSKYSIADNGYISRPEPNTQTKPVIMNIPRTIRFNKTLDANRCLLALENQLKMRQIRSRTCLYKHDTDQPTDRQTQCTGAAKRKEKNPRLGQPTDKQTHTKKPHTDTHTHTHTVSLLITFICVSFFM